MPAARATVARVIHVVTPLFILRPSVAEDADWMVQLRVDVMRQTSSDSGSGTRRGPVNGFSMLTFRPTRR